MKILSFFIKFGISIGIYFSLMFTAHAESPVWKVSKDGNYLYIGGTIHLLGYNDYPLPAAFEEVYKKSQMLVFETDINKTQDAAFQAKAQTVMKYSDGSTLKDHLKPETYNILKDYLKTLKIPIDAFDDFKPGMVSMTLSLMELHRLGINGAGVDLFYSSKAAEDHKSLGKLETIEQQLSFLEQMGAGDPDEFILYTLREIKSMSSTFRAMKEAWRKGDMDKLTEIGIDPLKKFPETYQMILVDRNRAWIPQIEEMMKTKEIEMILVGSLHLAGEDSVLNLLETLGYKVELFEK